MKRKALERHLREHGCRLIDEGGNHTRWAGPGGAGRSAVPRHREIDFRLAREICKQLGVPPPTARGSNGSEPPLSYHLGYQFVGRSNARARPGTPVAI